MSGTPSTSAGRAVGMRDQMIAACRRMVADGLTRGTSGNISTRTSDGILITPSNVGYATMTPDDLVDITLDGHSPAGGRLRPSSEWRMHARVYAARTDVEAIVHSHSTFATALACTRRPIPPFHYMVAVAGGSDVPCTPYATFGTEALAGHAAAALVNRDACLLANHGVLTVGRSLDAALGLALEVEELARQYCIAVQAGGPVLLTDAEMAAALAAFTDYRAPQ